jgi:threonylcarbamoyladenosine tRNA methylthiotransferase MtaB
MAKIRTVTLGCKVNQYETELVREGFTRIGYYDAAEHEPADLCVVNTCTVTNEGDAKSRHAIRKLARENPDAKIVVMGCYATRAPQELATLLNVSEVVTDKREIPDLLGRFGVIDIPTGISRFGNRHRAYVKVQDGCLLRCSYCIIPYVRPHLLSRPQEHIEEEVLRLVENGYREIVLTGVHLGHYGVEGNWNKPKEEWNRLSVLLARLAQLPGKFRLRLSSIEATEVTRELIDVMATFPEKIAPHLHLCLQSGSDSILRRMRRRWGTRMFLDRCQLLRDKLDNPAFTTDIIVGFPGETDDDFAATQRVCREAGFSKIHIFPFSARKGTPAAGFDDVVPASVKGDRCAELSHLEQELRVSYYRTLLGSRLEVLLEGPADHDAEALVGTSCRYAPVAIRNSQRSTGELVTIVPTTINNELLEGIVGNPIPLNL